VFDDFDGLTNVGTTLDSERERLWSLIDATPHLDWLLLTKRPQSIGLMIPARWRDAMPTNVWLGCTVEDQRNADERIPQLIQYPSVVRFVSIEPQLGPIDLSKYLRSVNWIIAGGESGAGSRPMEVAWARSIRDQAVGAGVSFFFKQWGNHVQVASTEQLVRVRAKDERTLDGRIWEQIPTPRLVATRPAPELAPRRLTEPTVIPTLVAMKTELLTAFASSCRGAYQIAGAYLAGSQLSLEERAKALYEGFSLALPSNMRKWAKANVTQAELTATVEANYKP
jgi:protein gp37